MVADADLKRPEIRVQAMWQRRPQETTQLRPENLVSADVLEAILSLDAYLVVDGRHHIALTKPIITIGRRADSDIVLDAPSVSRRHAQLRWRYGHFVLYDLSQRSGRTTVNNLPVTESVLHPGDVITLSQVKLLYAEGQTTPRRVVPTEDTETQVMPVRSER
jgi:hypothetical protein